MAKQNAEPKIRDWINTSATLIGIGVGIYVLFQNSQTIQTASDALVLSINPTLNVQYPSANAPDAITVRNTSPIIVTNIDAFPICYLISADDKREIVERVQAASIVKPTRAKLESNEEIKLSARQVINSCSIPETSDKSSNRFFSLVIVFHREIDNKRFVLIEPFGGGTENGIPLAIPMLGDRNTSSSGGKSISGLITSLEKITRIEKILFRADE